MTIAVTIKHDTPGYHCNLIVVETVGESTQTEAVIRPGESRTFYVHSGNEFHIIEDDLPLPPQAA